MKFNHLNVPDQWQHYWTKYPEGYTILEALISWVSQVDKMVDNVNEWNTYLNEFVEQFDTELQNTVIGVLNDWNETGFLAELINQYTNERIDVVVENLQLLDNKKIDKGNASVHDINTNLGKFDESYFTDELIAQMAGTADVSAVVADNSLTNPKYARASVSDDKTDFISVHSENMLNPNTFTPDTILSDYGTEIPYENFSVSDFIRVLPNTTYSIFYASNYYIFDANQQIIEPVTGAGIPTTFITPPEARFVRLTERDDRPYQMLVRGNTPPTSYVPYNLQSTLSGKLKIDSIEGTENGEILLEQLKGIKYIEYNLFTLENRSLNTTGSGYGTEIPIEGYDLSDYIEIEPNTTYRRSQRLNYFWFDRNKNFISAGTGGGGQPEEITSPHYAKYIRMNVRGNDLTQTLIKATLPNLGYIANSDPKNTWYEVDAEIKGAETAGTSAGSFSIIGDSFSTFTGWIPSTNATWYSPNMSDGNDVNDVRKTWWYMLSEETGLKLLTNDSWSGATVATASEMGTVDESHRAYVTRFHKYAGSGNVLGAKPDIIFVFGGTNDNTKNTEVGTPKYSGWSAADLQKFAPAFAKLLNDVILYNPTARIINITNNSVKTEIKDAQATICSYYGVENVVVSGYSSTTGHPNASGMTTIKNIVKNALQE